ncbi:MAG: GNAT family N-acetyltransferase [Alphaproteobacteria bacterium]|nr:GNAT family N-acetyltransferase [Alphaproteobacteria bacterium]MBV8410889.1 GNAT family N-acetyltransferase [Alphaproteobacteria bacterium]
MSNTPRSINGEPLTTKLAMRMEDSLHAFAVRAATFIGELDVPYSEEFDGHDFSATHIIAYLGSEPVGAVRVRWLQSFAMPERLAVIQRFRGHNIGGLLLERCRQLAESRGCSTLYVQVRPADVTYWEKQGWQRLASEPAGAGAKQMIAMVRAVDPSKPMRGSDAPEAVTLRGDAPSPAASGRRERASN